MSAFAFGSPGLALAAGAAVAVPVAIHLLLRRRRLPVEWAAMELLREAIRRVERRRRLERLRGAARVHVRVQVLQQRLGGLKHGNAQPAQEV